MTATTATIPRPKPAPRPQYDPLAEFQPVERPMIDLRHTMRNLGGVTLAATGIGVSVWVVYLLHAAVFRPEKLGLLHRLVSPLPADLVLTIPAGRIELPPAVLPVIAYVLLVALVAIGAKVAGALVKEGAWLLRHDPAPGVPLAPEHPVPSKTATTAG